MAGEVAKWVVVSPLDRSSVAMTGMLDKAVRPVVVVKLMSKVACKHHRPTDLGTDVKSCSFKAELLHSWHLLLRLHR